MRTSSPERIQQLTELGLWQGDTLHSLLAQHCRERPSALAAVDQPNKQALMGSPPQRLSFAMLDIASDVLASQLLARGVRESDVVMVQLPNCVELVVCFYALSKIGAVISPLPVQYGAHEIAGFGQSLNPVAFISCNEFQGRNLAERARGVLADVPVLTVDDDLDCAASALDEPSAKVLQDYRAEVPDDPHRVITICWTSGTTGTPKGVPRSHAMWLATARATAEAGGYQAGEYLLNPFPLVNMAAVGGFLFAAAVHGCGLFLHHPLDPTLFLQQLQDERINFTIAPPALLNQLAQQSALWQQFDFSAVRAIGSGSAPLSPEMIRVFEQEYGKPIINFYGSNEGISLFATPENASDPATRANQFPRLGVKGMPWTGYASTAVMSKVIDPEAGIELTAPGDVGELCFAGATVFDGYLGMDNGDVFTSDGFFRTGDLVEICGDPPNYYRIAGRCKDIINRGGMKISPVELDTLLETAPGVREAAVCAYPDQKLSERVAVCVVPSEPESPPSLEMLCAYLTERGVARFKHPERLEILTALPRNPMGKVVRGELQKTVSNDA